MEFNEVITRRESIRNYDPGRYVEMDVLKRILDAGRIAPSAANRQPWQFWLISSPEMLAKVRKAYTRSWFQDAPHVLAVVGRVSDAWMRQADGYCSVETDLTIAMDHMILAAENEGVGTCWIAAFDNQILRNALGLGENERIFAITPLGYQKAGFIKKGNKQRKSFEEVVRFV
jgi:nitroreductase